MYCNYQTVFTLLRENTLLHKTLTQKHNLRQPTFPKQGVRITRDNLVESVLATVQQHSTNCAVSFKVYLKTSYEILIVKHWAWMSWITVCKVQLCESVTSHYVLDSSDPKMPNYFSSKCHCVLWEEQHDIKGRSGNRQTKARLNMWHMLSNNYFLATRKHDTLKKLYNRTACTLCTIRIHTKINTNLSQKH